MGQPVFVVGRLFYSGGRGKETRRPRCAPTLILLHDFADTVAHPAFSRRAAFPGAGLQEVPEKMSGGGGEQRMFYRLTANFLAQCARPDFPFWAIFLAMGRLSAHIALEPMILGRLLGLEAALIHSSKTSVSTGRRALRRSGLN